jgi:hypothetical protein
MTTEIGYFTASCHRYHIIRKVISLPLNCSAIHVPWRYSSIRVRASSAALKHHIMETDAEEKNHAFLIYELVEQGCIQKFPDWPPGGRTANGTALCHLVQLYRYFVSQSRKFCRHNPLCCVSTSVYCCKRIFRYDSVRKLLDTPSQILHKH